MPPLPSTDLYFTGALGDQITRRWQPWRRRPIRRIGANSFTCGDWMVLIRQDRPRLMREALAWPGRLAYLIDDDVAGAATCDYLPEAYRAKLAAFDHDFHRPLCERADALLVPADALAELHGAAHQIRADIHRIEPVWRLPLADQAHFAPLAQGGTLQIVHLGSGSHAAALSEIAPAIARLLTDDPSTHFTYFAGSAVHAALEHHPRARRLEPKPWGEYQHWLARQRFHLALYPLLATRFDRARSASKLTEHAIIGAVGVYPEDWAPAAALGGGAILAPASPAEWGETLAKIDRSTLRATAACAAETLRQTNALPRQRALWQQLLGIIEWGNGATDGVRTHDPRYHKPML